MFLSSFKTGDLIIAIDSRAIDVTQSLSPSLAEDST